MKEFKEFSTEIINIGKFLTEKVNDGWKITHIQYGGESCKPAYWHVIMSRVSQRSDNH